MTTTTREHKVYQWTSTKISFHCHDEYFSNKLRVPPVTMMNSSGKSCFVVIEIHPDWRSYLAKQLASGNFRGRFSRWLILEMLKKDQHNGYIKLCDHCSMVFKLLTKVTSEHKTRIKVKMGSMENTVHNLEPEIRWSIRILPQVFYHLQLEAVYAWLSTLGGAHSALGDYFSKHAEIAWNLSFKQLHISLKLGDPVLGAHCKLFMAISLMQRRYFSRAAVIIRSVHRAIKNDQRLQEKRLVNCCKAARVRLKYIREERTRNGCGS